LFDSKRKAERDLAVLWEKSMKELDQDLKIRFNYPYRGNADGFTTYLRKAFPENYYGFELEVRNDVVLDLRNIIYGSIANLRGIID
jgi:predicted N-formylglutamate amidohydrolase